MGSKIMGTKIMAGVEPITTKPKGIGQEKAAKGAKKLKINENEGAEERRDGGGGVLWMQWNSS